MSKLADMRFAVEEQLHLIAEGKAHAATLVAAEELRSMKTTSRCWYRCIDVEAGLEVLAVFGVPDCDVYYCRIEP